MIKTIDKIRSKYYN